MNRALCLFLLLLCTTAPAVAQVSFDVNTLAAQLAAPAVVRGDFVQEKHLRGLPQALTSRGRFVLAAGHGLLWQLATPLHQDYRISHAGIARRSGQGWQVQPQQSVAAHHNRLFLAVLGGDYPRLQQDFHLHLSGDAQHWQLRLTPRSVLLGRIFDKIEIHGGALVEGVELHETQGDRTVLQLLNSQPDAHLSASEKADFGAD